MRRRATTGRCFGSNLTKKMPQGWFAESGRSRLISWILAAFCRVDAEFLRRVVEGELLEVVASRSASPARRAGSATSWSKRLDRRRARRGGRSASAQPSLSSIQHLSAGLTPDGGVDALEVGVLDVLLDLGADLDEGLLARWCTRAACRAWSGCCRRSRPAPRGSRRGPGRRGTSGSCRPPR